MRRINKIIYYSIAFLLFAFFILYILKINSRPTSYNFNTLENIQKYTEFYPEKYEIENNDWQDPSFTNFYKTRLRYSKFNKFLAKTGIAKDPIFNISSFEKTLKIVTQNQNAKSFNGQDLTIELKDGDKCFIFGDLHASLHSFARDLQELKNQKMIDNNLKIINPDTMIIFLGDTINRSPYSIETLNVILSLMEKNPDKVIYLKGNHEKRKYWRNFNMRRQIQIVFPELANLKNKNNLFDKIDRFFKTLPNSLVIKIAGQKDDSILVALDENRIPIEKRKDIKFMVVGEKRLFSSKKSDGLDFVDYDYGITKWALMSCPNVIYNKFLDFYRDCFVELYIGPMTRKSTLTLNYRDQKSNDKNFKQVFYAPISGKVLETKDNLSDRKTYNIGSTMYLSGITALIGNENKIGLQTAFYANNIDPENYLIKTTIFDDQYLQNLSLINVKNLIENYNITTIVYPTGTPTLLSYLNFAESGKISVFFPYTGGKQFRKKELKNLIHFRTNYNSEIISTMKYLMKEYQIKKFAFFYIDDSYGLPIAQDAHEELKRQGITDWLDLPHTRTSPNFDKMIRDIKEYVPEAIACISVEFLIAELIEKLSPQFFSSTKLFSVSAMNGQSFERFLAQRGIKQILSSVVPDPFTSDLEIAKEYRENTKARGLTLSINGFEGYVVGALMSLAINSVKPPVTKEKIMEFFESMNKYKFKGLELTFNPESRDLSQPVWIRTLDNKWVMGQN